METGKEVVNINLANIIPNRFQPRISFDEEALNELATSIKMYGIIQPLILRPLGDKYEIIAGERRYKAATIAGLTEVPAILVNLDDQTSAELAIIENIQRKDLTAIEEAKSFQKLLDLGNYTQDQLATKMGKSQSAIANKLRLLNLIPEVQEALMNNLISERHARSLLQLKDNPDKQKEILNRITTERLTVKDTDTIIKTMLGGENMNNNMINSPIPEQPINNNSIQTVETTPMVDISNINTNPNLTPIDNIMNSSISAPIEQPNMVQPEVTMQNNEQQNINQPEETMLNVAQPNAVPSNIEPQNNEQQNIEINNVEPLNMEQQPIEQPNIMPTIETPTNDIPNLNNDTFNLSQISDPNMAIPTTPQNNEPPTTMDFSTFLATTQINHKEEAPTQSTTNTQEQPATSEFDSLLQVEEKPEEKPEDTTPQPQFAPINAPTNVYFPDLEKEPANMSFANPFAQSTAPVETPTATDITNAINETKETIKKLETMGYKITSEESDLPDSYKITITIKKDTMPTT